MAKTRLTEEKRSAIIRYMLERYDSRHVDVPSQKLFAQVIAKTNTAIRKKYPEEDMVVLRKYDLGRRDGYIRFSQMSNGRVFALEISAREATAFEQLADLPSRRGCNSGDVFPASDAFVKVFDDWEKARASEGEARDNAHSEYAAFVRSCRTVEDCEVVMAFTPEFRKKLGAESNSLVAVNPDTIARIREEFADAA